MAGEERTPWSGGRYGASLEAGVLSCGMGLGHRMGAYRSFVEGLRAFDHLLYKSWVVVHHKLIICTSVVVIYRLAAKHQNASYYPNSPTT